MEFWKQSEKLYSRLIGDTKLQFMKGNINGCCKQPENLHLDNYDSEKKLAAWRCKNCNRIYNARHKKHLT